MSAMNFRRITKRNRLLLLITVLVIVLTVTAMSLNRGFIPVEVLDGQLRGFIRANFPLPRREAAADGRLRPVRRVHLMHKTHLVLPDYKTYVSTWRRVLPDYEIYFWTDADIAVLIASRYPKFSDFFRHQLANPLERSDFARILILHAFGGWYSDLDAGCQSSPENLTLSHSLILPLEPYSHAMVGFNRRHLVNNALMYSRPGHPYWMYYAHRIASDIGKLPRVRTNDDAVISTGPVAMTRAVEHFLAAWSDRCHHGRGYSGLSSIGNDNAGGGDIWCPYVPSPDRYLPLIDTSSFWLAAWARVLCLTVFNEPGIIRECRRLRGNGFVNQLPADAYTYHSFLHLTATKPSEARQNVSTWALDIRINPMAYLS